MAHVERGAPVVLRDIEWIGWNAARARRITVRVIQRVVAEQRKLRAHSNAAVHNELVLFENSAGLVLVDELTGRWSARGIRVNEICIELVHAAGIQVRQGKVSGLR